ncbi:MAG: hypothetical protein KKG06_10220 [Bacteroidetes bacterium]|nr:hypothetical protein [Bacteroidota bacterium]
MVEIKTTDNTDFHRFCITGGFGQAETHNDYECNSPKRTNTWTEESIIKAE